MKSWEAFSAPAAWASRDRRMRLSYVCRRSAGMGSAKPEACCPKSICVSGAGRDGPEVVGEGVVTWVSFVSLTAL
jgi:hypothetical protein